MAIKKQIGFNFGNQTLVNSSSVTGNAFVSSLQNIFLLDFKSGDEEEWLYSPTITRQADAFEVGTSSNGAVVGTSPNILEEKAFVVKKVVSATGTSFHLPLIYRKNTVGAPKRDGKMYIGMRVNRNIAVSGCPAFIFGKFQPSLPTSAEYFKCANTTEINLFVEFELDFSAKVVNVYYNNTLVTTLTMLDMDDIGVVFGNMDSSTASTTGATVAPAPILVANPSFMYLSSYYVAHDKPGDAVKTGRLGPVRSLSFSNVGSWTFTSPPLTVNWDVVGSGGSYAALLSYKSIVTATDPIYPNYMIGKTDSSPVGVYGKTIDSPSNSLLAVSLFSQSISEDGTTPAASRLQIKDLTNSTELATRTANVPLKSFGAQNHTTFDNVGRDTSLSTLQNYEFSIAPVKTV